MKSRGRSPVMTSGPPSAASVHGGGGGGGSISGHRHKDSIGSGGSLTLQSSGGGATPSSSSNRGVPSSDIETATADASPSHRLLHTEDSNHGGGQHLSRTPAASSASSMTDNSGLGNSIFYDDADGAGSSFTSLLHTPDPAMTQKAIDQIQAKIDKTKQLIRDEQTSRDDNVNEYLKVYSNADRQQQSRIKQVFEKKNQKSAQSIQHLQRKLDEYQRKLQELQERGLKPKQSHKIGQGLKSVGGNIRDGISGMSNSVMAKPKELAHYVLKKGFGSADNLSSISKDDKEMMRPHGGGSSSLPRENSGGGLSSSGGGVAGGGSGAVTSGGRRLSSLDGQGQRKCLSDHGRRSAERSESVATSLSEEEDEDDDEEEEEVPEVATHLPDPSDEEHHLGHRRHRTASTSSSAEWKAVMQELTLHKEEVERTREDMDELRQNFKQELENLTYQLRDERDRYERLEEQMNDLTELHQHEIENIKSGVHDMEEKVQYQSEERLLDIKGDLQSLEAKVASMEHQQAQQQYLTIEGLDSTDARAVMMKLLTALITVIHVILFVVGTAMNVARPFLRSTSRVVISVVVTVVSGILYYHQDSLFAFFLRVKPSAA